MDMNFPRTLFLQIFARTLFGETVWAKAVQALPSNTMKFALKGQGGATTHKHMQAGQTALGRSPVREEPQHTNTCYQPCRPDHTRQVACQGGAATHKHIRPTLLARSHLAGRRSGRSCNTRTCATNPAGQTALARSLVREEPQRIHVTNPAD